MPNASTNEGKEAEVAAKLAAADVSRAPEPEYDEGKLKELVLYLAEKSEDDPSFGDTKLNKLLFFSDFLSYALYGKPITGAAYQKLEFGPAPRRLLPARREMEAEGSAAIVKRGRAYVRTVTVNRREPDLKLFDTRELDVVNEVLDLLRNHDASEVSEFSHQISAGWKLAELYEDIPYDSIFLSVSKKLSPQEVERGQELAARFNFQAA